MSKTGRLLNLFIALFGAILIYNFIFAPYQTSVASIGVDRSDANNTTFLQNGTTPVGVETPCITILSYNFCLPDWTGDFITNPLVQIAALTGIIVAVGVAIVATGFLTSGASAGAVSAIATGLLMSLLFGALLLAAVPMFTTFGEFGAIVETFIALYGFYLIYQIAMGQASSSGE